jgi:hypothetical protein
MEEEKQPTIANPFARERQFVPAPKPVREKQVPKMYEPSFYISQASKTYVATQVEKGTITADELETIYKMAHIIGILFKRSAPTYSDIELATKVRTIDHARKLAAGEEQSDLVPYDKALEVMHRKDRLEFWKTISQQIVVEYDNPQV